MEYCGYGYIKLDKSDGKDKLRYAIVSSINQNMPVLLSLNNTNDNWNIITGYNKNGEIIYGFDGYSSYWKDIDNDMNIVKDGYLKNKMYYLIYTNGVLVNEKLLAELDRRGIKPEFTLSFDGVGCHDWMRGMEGAEQAAIDAIKLLKSKGFQVAIETVLYTGNKGTLADTLKLSMEIRMIEIPERIDPYKITTAVILNPDGTFSHVSTEVIKIYGKYYARINSMTNGTYLLIYNPKAFKDVNGHWAENDVNDMAQDW
mgnify:CR=1 FL=1